MSRSMVTLKGKKIGLEWTQGRMGREVKTESFKEFCCKEEQRKELERLVRRFIMACLYANGNDSADRKIDSARVKGKLLQQS